MSERHLASCQSKGKRPWHCWAHFQPDGRGRLPTTAEVDEWWQQHPTSNIGIALGAIVRIDIEGPEARCRLGEVSGGDLPGTLEFSSGRDDGTGEGWLYALPADVRLRTTKDGLPLGGELRLQALGAQTVLPPSRHPSGRQYTWKPGRSPADLAIAPAPAWLLAALNNPNRRPQRTPRPSGPATAADRKLASAALAALSPKRAMDYDSWLKVGMSLHSVDDGDELLLAWEGWSKLCPEKYEDGACESKWASFSTDGGLTLGSLIQWAQEDGWKPKGKRKERGPTNAEVLLQLALDGSELWHTADEVACATIRRDGHREHWPIRSKGYKDWLRKLFYDAEQTAIGSQTLHDVRDTIEARAVFDGPTHTRYLRTAEHEGKIYIDLAGDAWRAVEVDADGWRVVDDPPVRFMRPKGMLPLPVPEPGGSLTDLRPFVNVEDKQWPLIPAFLVGALRPRGPFPNLQLRGEQGSAKTTTTKLLRSLVDPNKCPVRVLPDSERDIAIGAQNGLLCAYDNLSYISPKISDVLCRLSTGGGLGTRELYSDDEEKVFSHMRPVVMNGIEEVGTRSDLMDRSMFVELPVIGDEDRKPEKVLWREFEQARPQIFGALLTAVSTALRRLPEVEAGTDTKWPRMADFAQWVVAAEPALGLDQEEGKDEGAFMKAYEENREEADQLALENSPLPVPLTKLLVRSGGTWEGTSQSLLEDISNGLPQEVTRDKKWPKGPNALAGKLSRLAPNLRDSGVDVSHRTEKNKKLWRFELKEDHPQYKEAKSIREYQEKLKAEVASCAGTATANGQPPGSRRSPVGPSVR